jgi:hypothetical protein
MKLAILVLLAAAGVNAADALKAFGREWSVPLAADWKVEQVEGAEVLRLVQARGPAEGPRRPAQFALTNIGDYGTLTVEADVKPLGKSLLIAFAYRDEGHFDYAHFSTDSGEQVAVHNGIFHVYGGERVRISNPAGAASFPANGRWYKVKLTHEARTGTVSGTVDGKPFPAMRAVDVSLGAGKVGIGSFDETAEFRNVKITVAR